MSGTRETIITACHVRSSMKCITEQATLRLAKAQMSVLSILKTISIVVKTNLSSFGVLSFLKHPKGA